VFPLDGVRPFPFLCCYLHADHLDLHSFPTRRSSDLDELLPFIDFLREQELGEELITKIGDELFMYYNGHGKQITWNEMQEVAKDYLRKELYDLPISGISYEKKYINVLGPTGVGKTTTIAKMAARAVLEKK